MMLNLVSQEKCVGYMFQASLKTAEKYRGSKNEQFFERNSSSKPQSKATWLKI